MLTFSSAGKKIKSKILCVRKGLRKMKKTLTTNISRMTEEKKNHEIICK